MLLEKATEEQHGYKKGEKRTSLKDTLTEQIGEQEQIAEQLLKVSRNRF